MGSKLRIVLLTGLILSVQGGSERSLSAQEGPWSEMDYGPFLSAAIEVSTENIACKGIAIPLTTGGQRAALFDTAELRWAAAWDGDFVELLGIVYDGPHGTWPKISGEVAWQNPTGPGVTEIQSDFDDPRKFLFGPLPKGKGRWKGLQRDRQGVLLHYAIGETLVYERMAALKEAEVSFWKRSIHLENLKSGLKFSIMELPIGASLKPPQRSGDPWIVQKDDGQGFLLGFENKTEAQISIESNRLILLAPASEKAVYCHLYLSEFETEPPLQEFQSLRKRVYLLNPSPLGETWRNGTYPTLYREKIELVGELNFEAENSADEIDLQLSSGSLSKDRSIDLDEGRRVMVVDASVTEVGFPAPLEGTILVIEEDRQIETIAGWDCDESSGDRMLSVVDGERDLLLKGVTWRRGVNGRALDFDGTGKAHWLRSPGDLLFDSDFTFSAWVCTTKDGSIFSQTQEEGPWMKGGKTFFIRDGRLCFDVGWVGVLEGDRLVTDGYWHHVAFSWEAKSSRITLYLDGKEEVDGTLESTERAIGTVTTIGFTAEDFPAETWFSGYIDGLRFHSGRLDEFEIRSAASQSGEPLVEAIAISGEVKESIWESDSEEVRIVLTGGPEERRIKMRRWWGPISRITEFFDTSTVTQEFDSKKPFEIDRVSWPEENPWNSWMRFGDFDFLSNGKSAAISTWSGDVWRVDGLDEDLASLKWQRIATGLSQPLGLLTREKAEGEQILVLGRDQLTELIDLNGDGETDVYRGFNVDAMNSPHFHEPAVGLQEGPQGKIYYLKAARHAKFPVHPQHGSLIEVDSDGQESRIIATGFRAPNGIGLDSSEVFWGSDQEGHWMPANRINRITRDSFHGNQWSGSMMTALSARDDYDRPLLWVHPTVDRSPSAQLRVPLGAWGELSGKLLGLSYGTGEVYLILEETVGEVHQGALVPLPIEIPTGAMRGRFHTDGSLYLCGLFGWSSDKTDEGGFYRVRKTATSLAMPLRVQAKDSGLVIDFSEAITTANEDLAEAFQLEGWNYRYSSNYGSPKLDLENGGEGTTHFTVSSATLSENRRQVHLLIEEMKPAMQLHLDWNLQFGDLGEKSSFVHFTIHQLAD